MNFEDLLSVESMIDRWIDRWMDRWMDGPRDEGSPCPRTYPSFPLFLWSLLLLALSFPHTATNVPFLRSPSKFIHQSEALEKVGEADPGFWRAATFSLFLHIGPESSMMYPCVQSHDHNVLWIQSGIH